MPRDPKKTKGNKKKNKKKSGGAGGMPADLPPDFEEDEMVMEEGGSGDEGGEGDEEQQARPQVWRPGLDGEEGEMQLECDPSTYDCLHHMRLEWPCLSFDVLKDTLGENRSVWPHTMFMVAGTQAASAKSNTLAFMRLTNVSKTWKPQKKDDDDDESSDSDSDDDMDDGDGAPKVNAGRKGSPVLHIRQVQHNGGVNRVRSCPQAPHLIASFSETAAVHVFDLSQQLEQLVAETAENATANAAKAPVKLPPKQTCTAHTDEGYALDWSPTVQGRLLSGDCAGVVQLWEPNGTKWTVGGTRFKAPSGTGFDPNPSVEDLQWSPSEATVFASASADQTVRIWDTRQSSAPALTIRAHTSDVNVISWSRITTCMLASGSDSGDFRIWDLRNFKADKFVASFSYHKQPITSIEWSPHEGSGLCVSSADNQVSFWDLSVERDAEEEAEAMAASEELMAAAPTNEELPAQLMFVHCGQKDVKEIHWHPNIPGMAISTAGDGFNVFRPNNL